MIVMNPSICVHNSISDHELLSGQSTQWHLIKCFYASHVSCGLRANKQIDGLVQERHNSIANAPELRLSYTNQSESDSNKHGYWVAVSLLHTPQSDGDWVTNRELKWIKK